MSYPSEPWSRSAGDGSWIRNYDGPIAKVGCGHGQEMITDTVNRIVACVNACKGIPTDLLQKQHPRLFVSLINEANVMQQQWVASDAAARTTVCGPRADVLDFMRRTLEAEGYKVVDPHEEGRE